MDDEKAFEEILTCAKALKDKEISAIMADLYMDDATDFLQAVCEKTKNLSLLAQIACIML